LDYWRDDCAPDALYLGWTMTNLDAFDRDQKKNVRLWAAH
jgi:hypothetical protein